MVTWLTDWSPPRPAMLFLLLVCPLAPLLPPLPLF